MSTLCDKCLCSICLNYGCNKCEEDCEVVKYCKACVKETKSK